MTAPEQLRAWIAETGRKQSWLAEQVGCADSRLSAWLTGRNIPAGSARASLARITGLDIADRETWKSGDME
jgi:hypothetical protein